MKGQRPTFSSEQDEILIEYVRENEELYVLSHKKYSDTQHKTKVWMIIGEKLQQDAQECKHRWESIRAQYRKISNSKKTRTGQAADTRPKWKYEEILEFLRPHMKDKERLTSVTNQTSSIVTDDESNESEPRSEPLSQDPEVSQQPEVSKRPVPDTREETPKRRKITNAKVKSSTQINTASSTLMNYLLEAEKREKCDSKDEIDYFFDSIKATVKTFTAADKHLAKNKIFMIVSDIESKYIGHQQHPQNYPIYHSNYNTQSHTYSTYNTNSQFQLPLTSPTSESYNMSPSATPIPSRPSSSASLPQSFHSSAASYLENFSPQNNFEQV